MSLALLGLVAALLVLAIPVAVIVLVVRAVRGGEADAERASWSLRRLLQYGFLLATLFVTATGLVLLLTYVLPEGPRLAGRATTDLALGLALVLVAGPAWGLLWRMVSRHLAADATERASLAYTLYLTAASTVSLIVALVGLVNSGTWALGAGDFDASAAASGIVYAAAWALHAWLARHRSLGAKGRLAQLVGLTGSAVGVVALGIGVAGLLYFGFQQVYKAVAGTSVLGVEATLPGSLRRNLVLAVLAAAVWWWHWLREASRGPYETVWHAYVMLVPILTGLLTATVSAAIVLHTVVSWLLGVPGSQRASIHFDVLPGALAAAAVGIWAWWYHRWILAERTGAQPGAGRADAEPDRAYRYLVGAVGLLAAAAGLTVALVTSIGVLAPAPIAAADPRGRENLAVAITLLVVGVPLWGVFWRTLQQRAQARTTEEVASPSRRAYLFLLFGASALTAISSLVVILYVLLRDLLEARLSAEVLYDLRVALALAVTAGALAGYHWMVYREDHQAGTVQQRPARTVLLVTSGQGRAADVAARTGATVRTLHRLDGVAAAWDPDDVAAAVLASPHERVLVLADEDGIRVIPYEFA